ncbi:MAG: hypothetical protein L0Y57_10160 [Beijerinckiaceae bacterium]|nr:hypothetical protein [Beijerinckiaceae bacterium]
MPQSRRLILHIGAPKTGTSAIQRFLASNIDILRARGFDYLNAEPPCGALYTIGNGLPLLHYFEGGEAEPKKLETLVNGYFGAQPTAIVSSERLSSFGAARWQSILEACKSQYVEASIIYYVRNVYPFYISAYNQLVKHHGMTQSFAEFVNERTAFSCHHKLNFFAGMIGQERVKIAHYESCQANICQHFLSLLCPCGGTEFAFDALRVNRSLDEAELRLMRIANHYPKAHFPGELPNILIASDPGRRGANPVIPEIVDLLTKRHSGDVAEINTRYFGGKETLRISDGLALDSKDSVKAAEPAEILFEWAIARLDCARHENFQHFLKEARAVALRSRKIIHPDLPLDFDPAAYLLANPDLLMARVDPYRHFLDHGRKEGRSWRIDGGKTSAPPRAAGMFGSFSELIRRMLARLNLC